MHLAVIFCRQLLQRREGERERDSGLLTLKRALPMPPGAYLAGKMLMAVIVALVMAVKLRLVSSYFLELHEAHPRIRSSVQLFCYGMPILVILTTAFGETLARLTGALI